MTTTPGYPGPTSDRHWWGPEVPSAPPPLSLPVPAPTVAEVRAWCGVAVNVLADEALTIVIDAETELQAARVCGLPDTYPAELPSSLYQALMRRIARQLAARGVPLGVTGADEYGPVVLPSYDTEIERLEAPWRSIPVG